MNIPSAKSLSAECRVICSILDTLWMGGPPSPAQPSHALGSAKAVVLALLASTLTISHSVLGADAGSRVLIQLSPTPAIERKAFLVTVTNHLPQPIVFCAEFGTAIYTPSGRTVAPNPFVIQKWTGKRWDTQLTGPDVGSAIASIGVEAGATENFRLQINGPGRYRLHLTYLPGLTDAKCPLASRHTKIVDSKPFDVSATE